MARVEYAEAPDIAPRESAPDDLQHVETTPNAFGGGIAQGLNQLGQGVTQLQGFYDKTAADNATNNTLEQATKLLHGDPNQKVVGPDGQLTQDTGFFGKRGADAMGARQETAKQIDDIIQTQRENLSTPQAQLQYDEDSRRYRAQWMQQMGDYSDQQQKVWATNTNSTSAQLALNALTRNPNDPNAVAQATSTVRQSYVRNAQLAGEDAGGAVLKADQSIAASRIRAMLPTDAPGAQKLLEENSGVLSSMQGYDQFAAEVKSRAQNAQLAGIPNSVLNGPDGRPQSADQMRENYNINTQKALALAKQQYPNDDAYQATAVNRVQTRMDAAFHQQEVALKVDNDTIWKAASGQMTGGHLPTSIDELNATSPQVASAFNRVSAQNPYQAMMIENHLLSANAGGAAAGYGVDFYSKLQAVLAPSTDPDYVRDPNSLLPYVGKSEHSQLSNSGFSVLAGLSGTRGTPQGEAQAAQMLSFIRKAHGMISGQSGAIADPKGEAMFGKWLQQALPAISAAQKAGNGAGVYDQKGDLYNSITNFMRPTQTQSNDYIYRTDVRPADQWADSLKGLKLDAPADRLQASNSLISLVRQGKIPLGTAKALALQHGLAAPNPPEVPLP